MPETFEYRVRDAAGKVQSGTLIADNQQLVVARLREIGYVPVHVDVQHLGMRRDITLRHKVKVRDLAVFSRQLPTKVNSGLPYLESHAIRDHQQESNVLAHAGATVG